MLDRIDMDIARGRVTAVVGPAGAGKSALLKLVTGQLRPAAGRVEVGGEDVHALGRRGLFELRRRIGVLFTSGALLDDLDVFDNVALPLREHTALPEALIRQLVLLRLEAVGLRSARQLMPAQLAAGMARRVALARALVLDPELILCDEPFAGQDPVSTGVLASLIRSLNETLGVTAVVFSRDASASLAIADNAYVVADGQVMGRGTPEELRTSGSAWTRQFVNGRPDGPQPFHYPGPEFAEELFDETA